MSTTMALSPAIGGGEVGGMLVDWVGLSTRIAACGGGPFRGRGGGFPPQEVTNKAVKAKRASRAQQVLDMAGMIPIEPEGSSRELIC